MMTATHRRPPRGRHSKATELRLLVLVGDSPASTRALEYMARLVGGCHPYVCLAYPLPATPPELLEFGGAEDPAKERRLGAELRADQRRWMARAREQAQKVLNHARLILGQAGVKASALQVRFLCPPDGQSAAEMVLRLARRHRCSTIVLGHHSRSWLGTRIHQELAEELLRRDHGLAVWLVGDNS